MFWFFGKSLNSVLNERKIVKIKGVYFGIQKIDSLAFLNGSKVMMNYYDVYKSGKPDAEKEKQLDVSEKKIREHMAEVLVAACVKPKLSFKDEYGFTNVNDIFKDMEITNKLYQEIMDFTYGTGKKKVTYFQKLGFASLILFAVGIASGLVIFWRMT